MTIFVIDIETTGLNGYTKGDQILEIGIAAIVNNKVKMVYESTICPERPEEITGNEWVFTHTSLTKEQVFNSPHIEDVRDEVISIVEGQLVTSYNTEFDFTWFLDPAWKLNQHYAGIAFDIRKIASTQIFDMAARGLLRKSNYQFVKKKFLYDKATISAEDAYNILCMPTGISVEQHHRAGSDALREAEILKALL